MLRTIKENEKQKFIIIAICELGLGPPPVRERVIVSSNHSSYQIVGLYL